MPNSLQFHNDQSALEDMVDRWSVGAILNMLETICYEKAEHLRSNWQDEASAKSWTLAGYRLDRCYNTVHKLLAYHEDNIARYGS